MKRQNTSGSDRLLRRLLWQTTLFGAAIAFIPGANAQVVLNEDFTGGMSTSGFTVADTSSDCSWIYAPGGLTPNAFNRDYDGALPSGAGFDTDFAFLDADECGASGIVVNSYLVSSTFDASAPGNYILSFSQQFHARLESFARVEVFNGTTWNQVANYTTEDVGYPNPAVTTTINITSATGGSSVAQLRFEFSAGWDWWWALDNIMVERVNCAAPEGLAVTGITTDGGTIGWTDNGSAGYQWVVTTGAVPDGTNAVASGDGTSTTFSGSLSGTSYTAYVRSDCGDGTFSNWSNGVHFTTAITNDDCSGAIALTVNPGVDCATVTPGTVAGATNSGITTDCGGNPEHDVWYYFVATDTAHIVSLNDIVGTTTDMYMALWSGDCGSLQPVPNSCSDNESALMSGLTPGATYYLQVYTYFGDADDNSVFNACIGTLPPPPANDECDDALAVAVNSDDACANVTHGTIASATGSGMSSSCDGSADDDVWFTFTATGTSQAVSLNNITGSTTDLYMALWSGGCGNLELVPNSCSDNEMTVMSGLTIGTTYYLQVYSWTSTPGQTSSFDVCVGMPAPPPANDECNGALTVTVNPDYSCTSSTPGTINGATDSGTTSTCFGTPNDDVWFMFTATDTLHRISLNDINGSTTDLYMALWSGDCGNLVLVPNSCSDPETMDIGGLTAGTTYYLQVYSYFSDPGENTTFNVCVGTDFGEAIGELNAPRSLSVYPNPASTELFINTTDGKPVHVKVYDMVGQLAMDQDMTTRLDISTLAPGSYSLVIIDKKGMKGSHATFMKQ